MALDSTKVRAALTGALSYAPIGTAAPTDADAALPAAWRDVGYISDDGVTETRDRSTNNVVAWQNAEVVRTLTTEASLTIAFTMIESNANSLELFYGAAVDTEDGSVDIVPRESGGRRAMVLDYVDGEDFVRLYLPQAEVTEVDDSTLVAGEAVGYPVTVTAYPDPTAGYSARKWFSGLVATP
jgi:hypothetical protein